MREDNLTKKPAVILLDVYETMFDMADMERRINNLMDSKRGYIIWFEMFMEYCFVDNCTGQFNDFPSIAKATMQMAAQRLGTTVSEDDINYMLELLKQLPIHEGVREGLSLLSDQGFRIAALTNSSEEPVIERMERTGFISYFETVLSAESVKKYKPCIEVYEWAAKKLDVENSEILLVSSHGWDIAGGANAGMETAFLNRDRQMFYPLAPKPTFTIKDLSDLAYQLETVFDIKRPVYSTNE